MKVKDLIIELLECDMNHDVCVSAKKRWVRLESVKDVPLHNVVEFGLVDIVVSEKDV